MSFLNSCCSPFSIDSATLFDAPNAILIKPILFPYLERLRAFSKLSAAFANVSSAKEKLNEESSAIRPNVVVVSVINIVSFVLVSSNKFLSANNAPQHNLGMYESVVIVFLKFVTNLFLNAVKASLVIESILFSMLSICSFMIPALYILYPSRTGSRGTISAIDLQFSTCSLMPPDSGRESSGFNATSIRPPISVNLLTYC